jgi:hypothetical protein
LNGRQPLCNGREEALHFFPQVRDRLAIAREMPQQSAHLSSLQCYMVEGTPEAMTNRALIASCGKWHHVGKSSFPA